VLNIRRILKFLIKIRKYMQLLSVHGCVDKDVMFWLSWVQSHPLVIGHVTKKKCLDPAIQLPISLSVCLSVYLICLFIYLPIYVSIYLFIYLYIYLSIYLSVYKKLTAITRAVFCLWFLKHRYLCGIFFLSIVWYSQTKIC